MTRRSILTGIALSAIAANYDTNAQHRASSPATPKQVATALLKLANTIANAQLSKQDRDKLSAAVETLSADIQDRYNTGALCSTDTDCQRKFGQ